MKKTRFEDIDISHIYDFMENGNMDNAPEEIRDYVLLMDKVRGMYLRIDKFGNSEAIIKHLITAENLTRRKAKQFFEETLEYFYCDSHVSKQAWKNIYADKMDKMINFAMLMVKDINDASKVTKMIMEQRVMRDLDKEDKEELPEELFNQPVKLYMANAAELGLPAANRTELKKFVEDLPELTEKEKVRLKQEADIDNSFKLFPDEQEDPRRS